MKKKKKHEMMAKKCTCVNRTFILCNTDSHKRDTNSSEFRSHRPQCTYEGVLQEGLLYIASVTYRFVVVSDDRRGFVRGGSES
jgi:hypothetical protein